MSQTLTPTMAKQIVTQYNDAVNRCSRDVSQAFADFYNVMGKEWEDNIAVDLSKKLEKVLMEIHGDLKTNSNTFQGTVQEIVNAYVNVGKMAASTLPGINLGQFVIVSRIKETFEDGETFGFKNPESASIVGEALTQLVNKLNGSVSEIIAALKSINAFGDTEITSNIAISAGSIVEILRDAIQEVSKESQKSIDQAAAAYIRTGASAAAAAVISK